MLRNFARTSLAIGLTALAFAPAARADTTVMGYFDTEYRVPDVQHFTGGEFQQHRLALLLQQELPGFKFFSELEYKYAPGIEDELEGAGAVGHGEIEIERAWVTIDLAGQALGLRVGKILEPGFIAEKHYPNIQLSIDPPKMSKRIFKQSVVGLNLNATIEALKIDLWTMRGTPEVIADPATGHPRIGRPAQNGLSGAARAAYAIEFPGGKAEIAATAAHYGDFIARNAKGAGLDFYWNRFQLWAEYATDETVRGAYLLGSYSFGIGNSEISPYLLYDQLKSDASTDSDQFYAAGLNYKPRPEIALKGELGRTPETTANPGQTTVQVAFAYFFN